MTQQFIDLTLGISPLAWAVLHMLPKEIQAGKYNTVETAPFYNGRECGFVISCSSITGTTVNVAFAEHRNSDRIVLYNWESRLGINPPTIESIPESGWASAVLFPYSGIADCVDRITEILSVEFP